jgi:Uncharacterised nucleotidyltransferase
MTASLSRLRAEERLLLALARLDHRAEPRPEQLADGQIDWHRFWALAHRHEVVPLCWRWVRADASRRALMPAEVADRAERVYFATGIRTQDRTIEALRILDGLAEASVDAMLVKGIALVHTVYRGESVRTFDDLDVLIRARDIQASRHALARLGYRTRQVPLFEEVVHRFHDLQYFRPLAGRDLCVELHWDLWDANLHRSDVEGLWARSRAVAIAGRPTTLLSDEDTLIHLAVHRTRAPLRLRFVCDIAELVRARDTSLDWEAITDRAGRIRARTALHVALSLAGDLLDAPVPADVLRRTAPGRIRQALLERTCGATAMFRPAHDGDLRQQPHLVLRALELDEPVRIAAAGGRAAVRKAEKWRYRSARRGRGNVKVRRAAGEASAAAPASGNENDSDHESRSASHDPGPVRSHE